LGDEIWTFLKTVFKIYIIIFFISLYNFLNFVKIGSILEITGVISCLLNTKPAYNIKNLLCYPAVKCVKPAHRSCKICAYPANISTNPASVISNPASVI